MEKKTKLLTDNRLLKNVHGKSIGKQEYGQIKEKNKKHSANIKIWEKTCHKLLHRKEVKDPGCACVDFKWK